MLRLSLSSIMENRAEEVKKGQMVALYVPLSVGKELEGVVPGVDADFVSPEDMHITIGLLQDLSKDNLAKVILNNVADELESFKVVVDEIDYFPPTEKNNNFYVLHAKLKSDYLFKVKDIVHELFNEFGVEINNGNHDFNPHITLAYSKEDPGDLPKKIKKSFVADRIYFVKNNDKTGFKLDG